MAGAAYIGRSPGSETAVGPCHVAPPSEDHATRAASLFKPALASAQASTMRFVASVPVGAPFAMSTLGTDARSVRAPVYPSITHRPESGSTKKHGSVFVNSVLAFDQCLPPSADLNMICEPRVGSPLIDGFWNFSANRYATPWLSVRIVHPDDPNPP